MSSASATCIHPRHGEEPPLADDGLMLCRHCLGRLNRALSDIVTLWIPLDETITHGNNNGTSGGAAGKPGSRPPCDIDAIAARDNANDVLGSWAALVIDERQLSQRTSLDGEQAARLLTVHAEWLAAHPTAADACEEVGKVAHWIRAKCKDLPDPPLGHCPDIDPMGQTDRCGGPLRWQDETMTLVCGRCGGGWGYEDLVHLGRVSPLKLWESVPKVAEMVGMSERTLRHWVLGGKVRRNSRGEVQHADVWRVHSASRLGMSEVSAIVAD
jgi:hypothetical protein